MSIMGRIFGTKEILNTAAKGVYDGVDAAFFTPEEKAAHFKDLLKLYEPYKLIQRVLAILVTAVYLGVWILSVIIYTISLFYDPCMSDIGCTFAQFQLTSKELAQINNETLGTPFATIMLLYFGGGMVEGAIRAKNGRT